MKLTLLHWRICIVVMLTAGSAALAQEESPPETADVKPCRIEGVLMLGGASAAGERVVLERNDLRDPESPAADIRYAVTDDDGRFVFSDVPPGEIRVGYFHVFDVVNGDFHELGATPSHRVAARVESGETYTIQIGGTGNRVTGTISANLSENLRLAYEGATVRLLRRVVPPVPYPADLDRAQRAGWYKEWINTVEGRQYRRAYTSYVLDIDEDGRFYAVDVPAGDYRIHIEIPELGRQAAGPIAQVDAVVTVVDSADPVDFGTVVASLIHRK